jgi:hypothetical protein
MFDTGPLAKLVHPRPDPEYPAQIKSDQAVVSSSLSFSLEESPTPEDDEPETEEEAAAVATAWEEHRRGEHLTTEELRRKLGLSWILTFSGNPLPPEISRGSIRLFKGASWRQ